VVHSGIIENYLSLKRQPQCEGYHFPTETWNVHINHGPLRGLDRMPLRGRRRVVGGVCLLERSAAIEIQRALISPIRGRALSVSRRSQWGMADAVWGLNMNGRAAKAACGFRA
jgi:hypothetical protein